MRIDKDEIYAPLDPFMRTVQVRMSLRLALPGGAPVYVEGLSLTLDRYSYERYGELGELDQYLHFEAITALLKHSVIHRITVGHPGDRPFPVSD